MTQPVLSVNSTGHIVAEACRAGFTYDIMESYGRQACLAIGCRKFGSNKPVVMVNESYSETFKCVQNDHSIGIRARLTYGE